MGGNGAEPDSFNLPLRPIVSDNQPQQAPNQAQTEDEEPHTEPQQSQVPASPGTSNASALRTQQCRARQRALTHEKDTIIDANQQLNRVRVVSFPHDGPPQAAFAAHSQQEQEREPEPEPEPQLQEVITAREQGGDDGDASNDESFDETMVQSTIVVATDEMPTLGCGHCVVMVNGNKSSSWTGC